MFQRRESQLSQTSAEIRQRKASQSEDVPIHVPKVKFEEDVIRPRLEPREARGSTDTQAIEQMLDDINKKLQESADEIVQVRFNLDDTKIVTDL